METIKNLPKPVQISGLILAVVVVGGLCIATYSEMTAETRAADESIERVNQSLDKLDQF